MATEKSKVVRISSAVNNELKKRATIGESPDDVLRRILKLAAKPKRGWRK